MTSIGTVSEGTLRTEDLLRNFADALEQLRTPENLELRRLVEEARHCLDVLEDDATTDFELPAVEDWAQATLDTMQDALNDYAPPFCYFGTLEGDLASFGIWPDFDALLRASEEGELIRVTDLADVPEGYLGFALVVNDHGNASLYEFNAHWGVKEHWSVV